MGGIPGKDDGSRATADDHFFDVNACLEGFVFTGHEIGKIFFARLAGNRGRTVDVIRKIFDPSSWVIILHRLVVFLHSLPDNGFDLHFDCARCKSGAGEYTAENKNDARKTAADGDGGAGHETFLPRRFLFIAEIAMA